MSYSTKNTKNTQGGRVACAIVTPECKIIKRMGSQNTIYNAEQEAINKKNNLN
jgi:hypothetical protein